MPRSRAIVPSACRRFPAAADRLNRPLRGRRTLRHGGTVTPAQRGRSVAASATLLVAARRVRAWPAHDRDVERGRAARDHRAPRPALHRLRRDPRHPRAPGRRPVHQRRRPVRREHPAARVVARPQTSGASPSCWPPARPPWSTPASSPRSGAYEEADLDDQLRPRRSGCRGPPTCCRPRWLAGCSAARTRRRGLPAAGPPGRRRLRAGLRLVEGGGAELEHRPRRPVGRPADRPAAARGGLRAGSRRRRASPAPFVEFSADAPVATRSPSAPRRGHRRFDDVLDIADAANQFAPFSPPDRSPA